MESLKKTLYKTLVWRVIATIITISISLVVSGDWTFALAVGSLDTIFKTVGYFLYERAWQKLN